MRERSHCRRVLRLSHAPHDRRRPVLRHHLGDLVDLRFRNAADFLHLSGVHFVITSSLTLSMP